MPEGVTVRFLGAQRTDDTNINNSESFGVPTHTRAMCAGRIELYRIVETARAISAYLHKPRDVNCDIVNEPLSADITWRVCVRGLRGNYAHSRAHYHHKF